ncbi:hypothetical protein [Streptomyces johnsoniae]|uniref:SnoaL-like domain-containing protein n=1 Tax=Streptomyces johnsoniae TaxID=3075532 RepID=A0ABU2SCH1_9ACTN|nr:hypothetical protein [Streptomyces sp. DSM 41886]MDT0446638.1 hypothetical protein [Streptomyces sp. DSM 41886]
MNVPAARSTPPTATVEALVRDWYEALGRGVPAEQLLPHLANGLRIDLPTTTLRGRQEFERWYRTGACRPLTGARPEPGGIQVHMQSPVHALASVAVAGAGDVPPARHEWWVVLQDGVPRIRTIAVQPRTAPHPTRDVQGTER